MFSRRPLLVGFPALLSLFVRSDVFAASPLPAGRVNEVRGSATGDSDNGTRVLSPNADVYVGEKISTAEQSRIEILLGADTKLRLGDMASIKIDRFQTGAGGEITFEQGPLLLDNPSNAAKRSMQVGGPFGRITVRRGRIFAGPSQGVFGILVVQGDVAVQAGGRTVRLRSGEGTDIKSPGAAPTDPRRWGAPRVQAALASVD
jgi:ferric-dicitrate binding protein FerR (iron transport regulator)